MIDLIKVIMGYTHEEALGALALGPFYANRLFLIEAEVVEEELI